jgi:hypothetical protein
MKSEKTTLTLSGGILKNFQRINYDPWHAVAEWVDNSIQSYLNNEKQLKKINKDYVLEIDIAYSAKQKTLTITDNAAGFTKSDLDYAFIMGESDKKLSTGLSEYNVGMKAAAIWICKEWSIQSKSYKDDVERTSYIKNENLFIDKMEIETKLKNVKNNSSYTILKFNKLIQTFGATTQTKMKKTLTSMYRKFIESGQVKLTWEGNPLTWQEFILSKRVDGSERKWDFEWPEVLDKKTGEVMLPAATGFFGWLEASENLRGPEKKLGSSRVNAGISIFRRNRMIAGFPDSWKPEQIFGEGGGRNDRANQRIFGEIHLDGATVTQDKSDLPEYLKESVAKALKKFVDTEGFYAEANAEGSRNKPPSIDEIETAIKDKKKEYEESNILDSFELTPVPSKQTLKDTKKHSQELAKNVPSIIYNIGENKVKVFYGTGENYPPEKSYLIFEEVSEREINLIINMSHPYITRNSEIGQYIDQCVFDALSYWKTRRSNRKDEDAVLYSKDQFMRAERTTEED